MKNEEALKRFKWKYNLTKDYNDPHWEGGERREHSEWVEQLEIAINALEKQIPKKPTPHIVQPVEAPIKIGCGRWGKGTTVYECPNCKEWVSKIYKHCHNCGQALDWRDSE